MNPKYKEIVDIICGNNWNTNEVSNEETDGGYGVAMVVSFLQGTRPKIEYFSRDLGVPIIQLQNAYKRLEVNGIWHKRSWVKRDPYLMPNQRNQENMLRAWCDIAGLASGFKGKAKS